MTVRPILLFPDRRLTTPAQPVKPVDRATMALVDDLRDTLYASPGVGLAAPQIGVGKRASVVDVTRGKRKPAGTRSGLVVLLNPELLEGKGEQRPREGCLSVPDWLGNVRRFETVRVAFETLTGEKREIEAAGFEALALQHEIDHLNGILFINRVLDLKTDVFRRKRY